MKKRVTSEEVKGMLLEGDFGMQRGKSDPLPLSDPITVTQLVLDLSQVKAYDRNPRKERNAEFGEIKASILKTKGLSNEISVTRRPGDDLYMVNAGGNTRLQILNELYKETGDEDFNVLNCLFKPWVSELHILTAHLIENSLRAEMLLIDKAYAIREMKNELEVERGEKLSISEFSKLATDNGYRISRRHITRFEYAIELDQMIPQLLRSSLGGRKIDEIKKLHQAYKDYCKGKTDQLEPMFIEVMSEHDGDEFNLEEVRVDLDEQLAEVIDVRHNVIYLEIQAILLKTPIDHELEPLPELNQSLEDKPGQAGTKNLQQSNSQARSNADHSQSINTPQNQEPSLVDVDKSSSQDNQKSITETTSVTSTSTPENTASSPEKEKEQLDLDSLRKRNYELACKIAKPFHLEHILYSAEIGLGFIVECPDHPFDIKNDPSDIITFQYLMSAIIRQKTVLYKTKR